MRHLVVTKSNCRRMSPGYGLLLGFSFICLKKKFLEIAKDEEETPFSKRKCCFLYIYICKHISLNVAVKFLMRT